MFCKGFRIYLHAARPTGPSGLEKNGWRCRAALPVLMILSMFWACAAAAQDDGPKRPLIFIPGIFGSKLCRDGDPNQLLWGSVSAFASFPLLKMKPDGVTSDVRVEPCGEIDQFVYFGPLGQDVYRHFLTVLDSNGYKRGKNLFVFSYDWRLSNLKNIERLERDLETFAHSASLGADGQFDVVGHSMGGLLATLLANRGNRRVARVITVSTPFLGSANLFNSLETGWGWVQRRYVSMDQVRQIALTFPSIYELLPVYDYCCALGRPGQSSALKVLDDLNKIQWFRSVPADDLNSYVASAKKVHAAVDAAPRISVAHLYGVQQRTPEQIYFAPDPNASPDALIADTNMSWRGDGTVMDFSASPGNDLDRLPGGFSHDRIMSDERIITSILFGLADKPMPKKIQGEPLATCDTSEGKQVDIDGGTLTGTERIVSPDEDVSITLSIRSSQVSNEPELLTTLRLQAGTVASAGTSTVDLSSAARPDPDVEKIRSETGLTSNQFYSTKFTASFKAPNSTGDATVEVRCGPENKVIAVWDFKVAQ
jgi:pimeloyl-ACP methyl ester carboxylesterase